MKDDSAPYRPVYHFQDDRLFEIFLRGLPRSRILDPFRNSESLRNRYFRGFRISNSLSLQQLIAAYRQEIVSHCNGDLASFLCTLWIEQQEELAVTALEKLGVANKEPCKPSTWLGDVHSKLASDGYNAQRLVQVLGQHFPHDDVRIFISLIGYNNDQNMLRQMVDDELQQIMPDPYLTKDQLAVDLQTSEELLKSTQQSLAELEQRERDETTSGQVRLEQMVAEHDALSRQFATEEAAVQAVTKQLSDLRTALNEQQRVQKATAHKKEQVTKSIDRQRRHISAAAESFGKSRKGLELKVQQHSQRVVALKLELQRIDEIIRAQVQQRIEEQRQAEEQKQEREETQSPALSSTEPSVLPETQKHRELVGNNALCYQGIQRVFRNAVVHFLRERLSRLYPNDHVERMRKPFAKEWEKQAENANLSRKSLGTVTTIRDDYDLLGTNHFYSLFDSYYDKLFSADAVRSENTARPVKARFLGNLKTIKDGRDPLSHPVEEEITFEEAHYLLITAKQVLSWLGCESEAAELSGLAARLNGGDQEISSVLRHLPTEDSIYLEFVGRDVLLNELAVCFKNPDNKRCLLAGDGGKGKTAVAYRFAQMVSKSSDRFKLIVWLSAKRRKFHEGVTVGIEAPDFTTAEDAVNRILTEYGAIERDLQKPFGEKKQLLFEFLKEFPALIISDDIDTVLDDDEVVSLFTHEIPQTLSAVLVTSRRAIPGLRNFVLQGFNVQESEQFIKSRIQVYGLDAKLFSPSVVAEIRKTTDGSPLYMDDLMRLTRIVDVKSAIRMWAEKTGDEARKYALQRELEQLSMDAKKVLIAAAVTDDSISFAELESVLEFAEERLLLALTELQSLFLFPRAPVVEGEQRYQINLNTKQLVRLVEGQSDLYARIESASKALTGKLPGVGRGVISSLIRQAHLRLNANQNAEAESILLGAIEKYPNAADLRGFLGYVYRRIGRIADARIQFEAAHKRKAKSADMFLQWIRLEIVEKEWSKAILVAERASKLLPENEKTYEIVERKVFALRQAGFDFYGGQHREKAMNMWTEAVEEIERRIKSPEALREGERQLNASMYNTIVVCLDMLDRFGERNNWLERWEKEHPDDPQVARQKDLIIRKRGTLHVR